MYLVQAAADGNVEAIRFFLASSGSAREALDSQWCGMTALATAAKHGHIAVVGLLLAEGADTAWVDRHGWAALHWAAYGGHSAVCKLLLQLGADPNARATSSGATPLHFTCRRDVAEALLEYDADPNIGDADGQTPIALRYEFLEPLVQYWKKARFVCVLIGVYRDRASRLGGKSCARHMWWDQNLLGEVFDYAEAGRHFFDMTARRHPNSPREKPNPNPNPTANAETKTKTKAVKE